MMPTPRRSKWFIATITGVAICVAGSKTPAQVGDDALRFEGHTLLVTTVAFSPDGKRLLVQSGDGVTIHDATTGKRLAKMEGPRSAHGMSAFSPDGKFVAGVVIFQLNIWDSATGKSVFQSPAREIYGNDEDVIAYSPDGKLVATPELVLKTSDGTKVGRFKNSNGDPLRLDSRVLFSPDGEMLAGIAYVGGSKKVITCRLPNGLVDATTSADVVFDTDNPLGDADDIALSADGRVLARLKGRAVVLRMLAGGTQPDIDCVQPEFRPAGIAFHPGGKYVALAGERSVQLFDVQTGKSAAAFNIGEGKGINSLAFSPDGSRMALGMWEQPSVLVWDVATGIKARIAAQEAAAKAETEQLAEIERKTAEIRAKRAEEKRQAEIEAAALRERMKQQAAEREAKEAEARRLAEIAAASRREQMQKEAAEREARAAEAKRQAEVEAAAQNERMKQVALEREAKEKEAKRLAAANTESPVQATNSPLREKSAYQSEVSGKKTQPPAPAEGHAKAHSPALPTFSDDEWEGMLAELWRQGKDKDAEEWQPALRLVKKIFVDQKIEAPSPRMICKYMNKFALFNSPPKEAAQKLLELVIASESAQVALATRKELLALEDGDVARPRPKAEERPIEKHGLMGVFPSLGRIPFGISKQELLEMSPVALKECECNERLVVEPFRNWEFPGNGVTAVYSDAYPVSDLKSPVQFIFRDDVLVGIGVDCGETDLNGVVSVSKVLEKVYGDKRLMGSRAKMEKVIAAIETKEFVGTARMCFGGGKAILQLEALDRPAAHVIFSNEDQSKWPEDAKTRRTLQLGGMDM